MTVSKNDLSYHFAVMRCRESQFCALDPEDIVAWRKRDLQIDVLVSDGRAAQRKYRDVVVDHVSIEEVMLLLCTRAHGGKSVNDTKGERV